MKNIKINIKMKGFFDYRKLKNHNCYEYQQIDCFNTDSDSDKSPKHSPINSIHTNCNQNTVIPNGKISTSKATSATSATTQQTTTSTIITTNIPVTTTTPSTNKAIIATIKNPLLNLDVQQKKNNCNKTLNTSINNNNSNNNNNNNNNSNYNSSNNNYNYSKKNKSKFILKTIKFPKKHSVQQQQQQQHQQQHLRQLTKKQTKNFKQNQNKIKLQQSVSVEQFYSSTQTRQKKIENFMKNCNTNTNNNNNISSGNTNNNNCFISNTKQQQTTAEGNKPQQRSKGDDDGGEELAKTLKVITTPEYFSKFFTSATITTTTSATSLIQLSYKKENFISRPKAKIYDYMKDFLRKKFNTLTPTSLRKQTTQPTPSTTLHDDDIYVEFPNCLLKVINNNLGSQGHKETHNHSVPHSPVHHHHQHHSHNHQPDINNSPLHRPAQQRTDNHKADPKKLQDSPQPPRRKNLQHQQLPSGGSIDNLTQRFDVMQDVRIRLEQIHKQQQQQQQQQSQQLKSEQPKTPQHHQSNHFHPQNLQYLQQQQQNHLHNHNHNQNHTNPNNTPTHRNHNHYQQQQQQQQQPQQQHGSPNISNNITPRHRPNHLFAPTTAANLNTNGNEPPPPHSPSSEEDNSPTEMNNCRRLVDKPPLVKRITMGLFGSTEDSRPLVHTKTTTLNNEHHLQLQHDQLQQQQHGSTNTIDGYVNEGICEPEKIISSKFGDSCRQSLTAISTLDKNHFLDNSEFNFKKKYMRETCSANSSPRIFGPSALLKNKGGLSPTEQIELKGAAWFQAGISRDIAVEVLASQSPGSFLVRSSNTKSDCFVLSVRVPPPAPKVAHYLILRTIRGYKIKGFTKEFTSLKALITHHSVMPELLPVPLSLPRPTTSTPRRRNCDDFESYGSLRLLGILNMMQTNHNCDRENNS